MVTEDAMGCFRKGPATGQSEARLVGWVLWLVTSNYIKSRVPHRHSETLPWILAPSPLHTKGNFLITKKKIIQGNQSETLLL